MFKTAGDNGEAEDLIVGGFDVSGSVVSGDLAMAGVNILMFGDKSAAVECKEIMIITVENCLLVG